MQRKYELTFILKPDLPPEVNDQIIDKFRDIVNQQGSMVKIDVWGKKKMTYEIGGANRGLYVNFLFEGPPDHIKEIERTLKIHQDVLRYLTIRLDDRTDLSEIRAREEEKRLKREADRAAAAAEGRAIEDAERAARYRDVDDELPPPDLREDRDRRRRRDDDDDDDEHGERGERGEHGEHGADEGDEDSDKDE